MAHPTETGVFQLGDVAVRKGGTIAAAKLSWKTHGTLNAAKDNAILYPTSYGGRHPDLEWLIKPNGILDPGRWFIIQVDMFGNGLSSSPSNTQDYPALVTAWDNVAAQRRLLLEYFGLEKLHGIYGWSMGAQQAYHFATAFPDAVSRIVVNCGSARTAVHNRIFLQALIAVLEAAPEYRGGYEFSAQPLKAMRAFGRIYAAMALSQDFYRADLHHSVLGAPDLMSFLRTDWEERFAARPAGDHLAQLRCWDAGDIADGGDLAAALRSIKAQVLLMPSETDIYFRVADNAAELPYLAKAILRPIPSIWGHRAGNPIANPPDAEFIRDAVNELFLAA